MYAAGGSSAAGTVDTEKEAYLLGKKRIDSLVEQGKSTQELSAEASFTKSSHLFYGMMANTSRDMQAKVREDPLLAIK